MTPLMQPRSDSPSPDPVKKPKLLAPLDVDDYPEFPHHHHRSGGGGSPSAALHGLHHYLSARPLAWLVVTILAVQLLLLLSARSIPTPLFGRTSVPAPNSSDPANVRVPSSFPRVAAVRTSSVAVPASSAAVEATRNEEAACEHGRVYVYDLPPVFNKNLLDGCDDLNPWSSRCEALSNGGFGRPSNDLAGVVPDALLPSWYATDQFAAELIFHRRMLDDRCRTLDPSAATAFFIPFYGGLAVGKYLWLDDKYTARDRDRHGRMLLRWIRDREPWRRSQGRDHFIVLGRITWDFRRSGDGEWGGSFLHMPGMEKVTRLLIERNPWDDRDVGVPYPTGFHPRSSGDLRAWQDFVLSRPRSALFCFAGAPRSRIKNDFRGVLLDQCRRSPGAGGCRSLDCSGTRCSNRTGDTLGLFLDSAFCLQPRGDSFTRRSTFDCMVAGSIPVFFWRRSAYAQYEWFLPADRGEYSVFIDRAAVRNGSVELGRVLAGLGEERVRRMRERVVELIPRLVYAQSGGVLGPGVEDAFDVALKGVLRRFREEKESWWGNKEGDGKGEAEVAAAAAGGGDTAAGPVG